MLFCVAWATRVPQHLPQRRAMEQLSLDLTKSANPHAYVWEGLAEQQRAVVLEILARLIANAAQGGAKAQEEPGDE
jgi:hypothetical protein